MEDLNMNKLNESELSAVDGGAAEASAVKVRPIEPIWVEVTSSSLNCRYTPNGEIAKVYEKGHRLKVDGITEDGEFKPFTRDTFTMAIKATYCEIDGKPYPIFKSPKEGQVKKSQKGACAVYLDENGDPVFYLQPGDFFAEVPEGTGLFTFPIALEDILDEL